MTPFTRVACLPLIAAACMFFCASALPGPLHEEAMARVEAAVEVMPVSLQECESALRAIETEFPDEHEARAWVKYYLTEIYMAGWRNQDAITELSWFWERRENELAQLDPVSRFRLAHRYVDALARMGQYQRVREACEFALAAYEETLPTPEEGMPAQAAMMYFRLSEALLDARESDQARANAAKAWEMADRHGDISLMAWADFVQAEAAILMHDGETGVFHAQRCLDSYAPAMESSFTGHIRASLVASMALAGDLEGATREMQLLLEDKEVNPDRQARALFAYGEAALWEQEYEEALTAWSAILEQFTDQPFWYNCALNQLRLMDCDLDSMVPPRPVQPPAHPDLEPIMHAQGEDKIPLALEFLELHGDDPELVEFCLRLLRPDQQNFSGYARFARQLDQLRNVLPRRVYVWEKSVMLAEVDRDKADAPTHPEGIALCRELLEGELTDYERLLTLRHLIQLQYYMRDNAAAQETMDLLYDLQRQTDPRGYAMNLHEIGFRLTYSQPNLAIQLSNDAAAIGLGATPLRSSLLWRAYAARHAGQLDVLESALVELTGLPPLSDQGGVWVGRGHLMLGNILWRERSDFARAEELFRHVLDNGRDFPRVRAEAYVEIVNMFMELRDYGQVIAHAERAFLECNAFNEGTRSHLRGTLLEARRQMQ